MIAVGEPLAISLDDPAALKPGFVGAKAEKLAVALQAGLPVLPGVVLPVTTGRAVLERAERIASAQSLAAARLFIMNEEAPPCLTNIIPTEFGLCNLVVRSSSPLEALGSWSGAFASYIDVTVDDLPTAILGCWASVFSRDAAERYENLSTSAVATGMAVLIQPAIDPCPGGTSRANGDGSVSITLADGSLPAMLQGWAPGLPAVIGSDDEVTGRAAAQVGHDLLREVARYTRLCVKHEAGNFLEWAAPNGDVLILQCKRSVAGTDLVTDTQDDFDPNFVGPLAVDVCRAVVRFGGSTGDSLVLPWILAPTLGSRHSMKAHLGSPLAIEAIQNQSKSLVAQAWRDERDTAEAAIVRLRDGLDPYVLNRIAMLNPVTASEGIRVVEAIESLGQELVRMGVLCDVADVWRLEPEEFRADIGSYWSDASVNPAPPKRNAWEAFLRTVVRSNGEIRHGTSAAAGEAAAPLLAINEPHRLSRSRQQRILYVPTPLPGYAPMLWGAAGLVAAGGNPSAHLVEVASSLGVPAVVGCNLGNMQEGTLAAVYGASGEVWLL
jgi:hypothetical protein